MHTEHIQIQICKLQVHLQINYKIRINKTGRQLQVETRIQWKNNITELHITMQKIIFQLQMMSSSFRSTGIEHKRITSQNAMH